MSPYRSSAASESALRAEAVHQDQRQARAGVALAQRDHLPRDQVQERQPVLHLEQRLGHRHAHARAEPAVELQHDGAVEQLAGVRAGLGQVVRRRGARRPARSRSPPARRARRRRTARPHARTPRSSPPPRRRRAASRGRRRVRGGHRGQAIGGGGRQRELTARPRAAPAPRRSRTPPGRPSARRSSRRARRASAARPRGRAPPGTRARPGRARASPRTRSSTASACVANERSITADGWPSADARFTTRPRASRLSRLPPTSNSSTSGRTSRRALAEALERAQVDLDVEVPGVGEDRAVLHPLEVLGGEHRACCRSR